MELPRIGLGTHTLRGGDCTAAVLAALEAGLRLIDTASVYRNEEAVGAALAASSVPRSDIFLVSKANPKEMRAGYSGILQACEASLGKLGTSYLDLYLLHWPGVAGEAPESAVHKEKRAECWKAMHALVEAGKVRKVGVSNFTVRHLEELVGMVETLPLPFLNQIELHPLCRQSDVVQFCLAHGIAVQQYSPLAKCDPRLMSHEAWGQLLPSSLQPSPTQNKDPAAAAAAERLGIRTPHDAVLLWGLMQQQMPPQYFRSIALRTQNPQHMQRAVHWDVLTRSPSVDDAAALELVATFVSRNVLPHKCSPPQQFQRVVDDGDDREQPAATDMLTVVDPSFDEHTCWFANLIA